MPESSPLRGCGVELSRAEGKGASGNTGWLGVQGRGYGRQPRRGSMSAVPYPTGAWSGGEEIPTEEAASGLGQRWGRGAKRVSLSFPPTDYS